MRIWAKRGIQAALVTGGMIALGTGVANAGGCEATCPPQPHGSGDGAAPAGLLSGPGVDVPIHAANNKIGTPLGVSVGTSVLRQPDATEKPVATIRAAVSTEPELMRVIVSGRRATPS